MNNGYSVEAILKATGADKFASDFEKAGKSISGLTGSTKKATGGVKSFMGGVGKLAGAIGITKLVSAGFSAIRSSVDGAITRVDTLNQFPKVLQQMGYTADEASGATERLSDGIQGLPTRLDEVVATTQRFVTAFGDVDLATESTLALNNALLASGASTQQTANATDQYVKTMSSGKLEMDTWNTLSETMSYGLSEVAKDLGIADGNVWTLYDSIQDGDITLKEFNQAMIDASNETGGFAETALTASEGLRTSWSNIQTAIATGVANVIQAINDWMADNGLGGISKQFDNVKVAVQEAFKYIVENIPNVLNGITGLFDTIKNSTAFQTLKEVIVDVVEIGKELISAFLESEAWANFKGLMGDVAQAILDIDFGQVLQDVGEFIDKWSPLILGIMGAITAFKVISGVITGFKTTVTIVTTAVKLGGAAIAFLTSPIGLAVAAIGIIIGIGVLLYKNWDTIKEKAQELGAKISEIWENIKAWTSETWEGIKTAISDAVLGAWNAITEWFGQLPTWFSETWNSIVESVTEWATNMIEKAIEVGTQFVENISTFFSELPYNVGFFLGEVIGTVIQWGIDMWNKAIETGSNFIEAITTFFSELPGRVSGFLTTTWTNVTTWASNMWTKAKETGANFINGIVEWFSQLPGRISNFLSNAWTSVTAWASNMWNKAKETGSNFINGIVTWFQQLPSRIQTWLTNAINRVTTWATNLGNKGREAGKKLLDTVISEAKKIPSKITSVGKDVVNGFWNGIKNMGSTLKKNVSNFFGGIVDGVKSKLKIFSPSRVFRDEIGKMIVKGFGQGIDRNEKEAINPMNRMLDNVIGVFDSQTSGLGATFSVTGEGNIANAMNRALDVDMPMVNGRVSHSVNMNTGRTENLLEQLVNSNQVIVLDSGELVGATYSQYDRVGGNQTQLTERWGR